VREGVGKDRVISTVDLDMRHGHKSLAGRWDGCKKHASRPARWVAAALCPETAASTTPAATRLGVATS
jgi:hypothetical protein